jgi:O-antigen ligase
VLIGGGLFALSPFLPSAIARFRTTVWGAVTVCLWVAFGVACLISSVLTYDDARTTASTLWILLGVPVIFFLGLPGLLGYNAGRLAILALFVSHALYVVVSFYLYPDLYFEYRGLFGHPNEMGMTAAVLALCCLAWIVERAESGTFTRKTGSALAALFGASCFLVVASGSRTSLLAVLITTAAAALVCARSLPRRRLLSAFSATLLLLFVGITLLPDLGFVQKTWDKHMQQLMKGDVLSKRDEIWETTITDMRFWGNGGDYFTTTVGISAHNSLMHIIGERGPVAALFMVCFAVVGMLHAFRQALSHGPRRAFRATPVLISICFWTLSTGEGMFGSLGTGITLAYFLSVGMGLTEGAHFRAPVVRFANPAADKAA